MVSRMQRLEQPPLAMRSARTRRLLAVIACLGLLVACDQAGAPAGDDASGETSLFGSPLAPDASLHEILRHPDIFERTIAVSRFFQQATPDQLDEIQHEFRIAPLDRGDVEYALFGVWWARFDPKAAYFFAESNLRFEQPRIVNEILRTWAFMDPHGLREAEAYGKALVRLGGFRSEMFDAIVVGWYESGEPGLDDFIFNELDAESRQIGLKAWVRMKVLHEGPEAALEWTQSVDYHKDTKRLLLAAALAIIAHEDPQLCIEWLDKANEMGIDTGTFVARIANVWGHHDPKAALDWVLEHPDNAERFRAIQRVARKWRQADPVGMQDWLDEKEAEIDPKAIGLLRYQTYNAIVEEARYTPDWNELLRRASKLSEDERGPQIRLWVLQRWHYVDPEAANAWLAEHPDALPPVLVERVPLLDDDTKEQVDRALGRLEDPSAI